MPSINVNFASALAVAALAYSSSGTAQIVVSRAGEREVHREQRYGYCWVDVAGASHVSGVVFLPRDDIRAVFLKQYEAYATANIGSVRDTFCRDDYGYAGAAEDDIQRWITNNPSIRYVRNGWTGGFPTQGPATGSRRGSAPPVATSSVPRAVAPPVTKGPTPNQLKYQRELAEHQRRLAEIEQIKLAAQSKLASDKAAAQQVIERHRQEVEVNRRQADRAKRQYEQELAAHQALVKQMRSKTDREALADWPEAVTVCELNAQSPQAKFGNWRCEGPLQFDYAKLGNGGSVDPKALFNVSNACGGKVESVRDLGLVGGYRVFGCSFGMHPKGAQRLSNDTAAKFGLGYVPGRITYRCPTYVSYCRTR